MIIVYSTPTCPYCKMVKKFLEKNGIEFTDKDVSGDSDAADHMVKKSGQMGVPVIEIDDEIIVGFDKPKIKKKLGI